jgi:hypothetical protein
LALLLNGYSGLTTHSQSLNTSSLVTLGVPSALAPRVLNALKADPRTVDLRALATHFYNLGARNLELYEDEEMIEVLSEVLTPARLLGYLVIKGKLAN